ncbi:putative tail protein [Xylophilus phage Lumi]|nr:putative tail protein [Xylophilus phage Lumi]
MATDKLIGGSGGGSDQRSATRTPDNLQSQDFLEALIAIAEGPISGLHPGVNSVLENFLLGDTALANNSGKANFPDFNVTIFKGRDNDPPVAFALGGTSANDAVNTRLAYNNAVTRTSNANLRGLIDRIEVRLQFSTIVTQNDDGVFEADAQFRIQFKPSNSPNWANYNGEDVTTIHGKTTSGAVKDFILNVERLPNADWDVRVVKVSPDNLNPSDNGTVIEMSWESTQYITAGSHQYSNLALAKIYGKASNQFTSVPQISGIYDGLLCHVPTNYNPITKTYDESTPWNGTFKLAFTNNPYWQAYELIINPRFGMARYYLSVSANRYDFYAAAKWADQQVAIPGTSDTQARFTFNAYITEAKIGTELINYIVGSANGLVLDDGNGVITLLTDEYRAPSRIFMPDNITAEGFNYTSTDITTRYNYVTASFVNPDLDWGPDRRLATIDMTSEIERNGYIPYDFQAVGCTNIPEAIRKANYRAVTATTETETVTFSTTRLGMFLNLFDTIYIADPDAGWSYPGRIKSVSGNVIQLRDPIYFLQQQPVTMMVQGYDGIQTVVVIPPSQGIVYSLNIQSGVLSNLPDRAAFTVEDTSGLGLAKPFRVLRVEEGTEAGVADIYKIVALEVNANKYPDSDSGVISTPTVYSFITPGEATLPLELDLDSGKFQIITTSDGTLIHRILASWQRPVNAFTDHYEIDWKETGTSSYSTMVVYGDSDYIMPVKDGARYDIRLFAITPFGQRSGKYLERAGYLVTGKIDVLSNIDSLTATVTDNGWEIDWTKPTFPDQDGTDVRYGPLPLVDWDNSYPLVSGGVPKALLPFQPTGHHQVLARWRDTSGNYSAEAKTSEFTVVAPLQPNIAASRMQSEVTLEVGDCRTTQPIRYYTYYQGTDLATAELLYRGDLKKFSKQYVVAGYHDFMVVATDMAGNDGPPGQVRVETLPSIEEAIDQQREGLDEVSEAINGNQEAIAAQQVALANERIARAQAIAQSAADEAQARTAAILVETNNRVSSVSGARADAVQRIQDEADLRVAADLATANALGDAISKEVTDRSNAIVTAVGAEASARVTAIGQEVADRTTAISTLASDTAGKLLTEKQARESAVSTESSARVDGDAAVGSRVDAVVSQANTDRSNNVALVNSEAQTRADKDGALAIRIDTVVSQADTNLGQALGAVQSEAQTRATQDGALAGRIDTVVAQASTDRGNNVALVQSEAQTRADQDGALASRIDAVISSSPASANQFPDAEFLQAFEGWEQFWGSSVEWGRNVAGSSWQAVGFNNFGIHKDGPADGERFFFASPPIPVTGGSRYIASVYAAAHRSNAQIMIYPTKADGTGLPLGEGTTTGNVANNGGSDLNNWLRIKAVMSLPAEARYVRVAFVMNTRGALGATMDTAAGCYTWFTKPMFEEVGATRFDPSPWSNSGAGAMAAVISEATTRAGADGALAGRIDTVVSQANTDRSNSQALVNTEAQTRASADLAQATLVTTVASRLAGKGKAVNSDPYFTDPNEWFQGGHGEKAIFGPTPAETYNFVYSRVGGSIQSKLFPVVSGRRYRVSGLVMADGPTGNFYFRVLNPAQAGDSQIFIGVEGIFPPADNVYRLYSGDFVCPDSIGQLAIRVILNWGPDGSRTAQMYLQNFRMEEITAEYATQAAVTSEATTRATEDGALAGRIDTVVSQANTDRSNTTALIGSEAQTRALADSAQSTRTDSVVARLEGDLANYIYNPAFRTDSQGYSGGVVRWFGNAPSVEPTPYFGRVTSRENGFGEWKTCIPGEIHYIEAAMCAFGSFPTTAGVTLLCTDQAGNNLSYALTVAFTTGEGWKTRGAFFQIPEGARQCHFRIFIERPDDGDPNKDWALTNVIWRPATMTKPITAEILRVENASVSRDQALTDVTNTQNSRLQSLDGTVSGQATDIANVKTRVSATESGLSVQSGRTDTLSSQVNLTKNYTLIASAGGSAPPMGGGVYNDKNQLILTPNRSWNTFGIDSVGNLYGWTTWDVFAGQGENLSNAIASNPHGTLTVFLSFDEPQGGITPNLRYNLMDYGGTAANIDAIKYRGAYILIGYKGAGQGQGIELVSPFGNVNDGESRNWLRYALQVVNGWPVGLNGSAKGALVAAAAAASIASDAQTRVGVVEGKVVAEASKSDQIITQANADRGEYRGLVANEASARSSADSAAATRLDVVSARLATKGKALNSDPFFTDPTQWYPADAYAVRSNFYDEGTISLSDSGRTAVGSSTSSSILAGTVVAVSVGKRYKVSWAVYLEPNQSGVFYARLYYSSIYGGAVGEFTGGTEAKAYPRTQWVKDSYIWTCPEGIYYVRPFALIAWGADGNAGHRMFLQNFRIEEYSDEYELQASVSQEVTARVNADGALAGRIDAVIASSGASANLMPNAEFLQPADGWSSQWQGLIAAGVDGTPGFAPAGMHCLSYRLAVTGENGFYASPPIPISGQTRLIASAWTASHRGGPIIGIWERGVNLEDLGQAWSATGSGHFGGPDIASHERLSVAFNLRSDTRYVCFVLRLVPLEADAVVWMTMPMIESAKLGQTQPSPWAPGGAGAMASIISEITARTTANSAFPGGAGAMASIISEITARTTANSAFTSRVDQLVATVNTDRGNNNTAIYNESQARAGADGALGSRVDGVISTANADRGSFQSAIQSEALTRSNADSANATLISTVSARLAGQGKAINSDPFFTTPGEWIWGDHNEMAQFGPTPAATYNYVYTRVGGSIQSKVFPVVAGRRYRVSGLVMADGESRGSFFLRLVDPNRTGDQQISIGVEGLFPTISTYTLYSGDFVCPDSIGQVALRAILNWGPDGNRAAQMYLQNFRIEEVTAEYGLDASISEERTARINADGALATDITTLRAASGPSGNLLPNSEFLLPFNWFQQWGRQVDEFGTNLAGADWQASGHTNYGIRATGPNDGERFFYYSDFIPVNPGGRYIASAYMAAHRSNLQIALWQRGQNFEDLGVIFGDHTTNGVNTGGRDINAWNRCKVVTDLRTDCRYVCFVMILNTRGAEGAIMDSNCYAWITMPMLEQGRAGQEQPSPWGPGGAGAVTAIVNEQTARTGADGALGSRIDSVVSTANTDRSNSQAAINSEAQTRASGDSAQATRSDSIQARLDTDVTNLCYNPKFEINADGWNGVIRWAGGAPQVEPGPYFGRCKGRDNTFGVLRPVQEGEVHYMEMQACNFGGGYGCTLGLMLYDTNKNFVTWMGIVGFGPNEGWKRRSGNYTIGKGIGYAHIWVQVNRFSYEEEGDWAIGNVVWRPAGMIEPVQASITAFAEASANRDSALTTRIDNLTSTVGQNSVNISTTQTAVVNAQNQINGAYTVAIGTDLGGRKVVTGFTLQSNGEQTEFLVQAQRFAVSAGGTADAKQYVFVVGNVNGVPTVTVAGNLIADGSILARSLNIGQGSNLLPNAEMNNSSVNWRISDGIGTMNWGFNLDANWFIPGARTIYMRTTGNYVGRMDANNYWFSDQFGVTPGARYELSAYTGAHRCYVDLTVTFFDYAGNSLGEFGPGGASANDAEAPGGSLLPQYKRIGFFQVAPSNAARATFNIRKYPTKAGYEDSYMFMTRPLFAEAGVNQTVFSAWSPGSMGTVISPQGISTPSLAAITANMGDITAGRLVSPDGQFVIDLTNKTISISV